jgi:CHAT domain-containing protein
LIAAHADRRLIGDEAARMDEHIAGCSECYAVFSETVQFGLAEAPSASVRRPVFGRPAFKMAAGLAAAAVLVLAIGVWQYRARFERGPAAPLTQLAEAMGTRRFVEPRLTGGFQHGRLTTLRSGDTQQGLDAQSPAVLSAVARIREQAEGDTSPEALGALGVTYLVSGDAAAAVKALESASAQKPDDPRLLSDLAAAYLVRAAQADEPADIPRALEMAERAIALKNAPPEAWFNRALALERLHLVDAARKAWADYLERDSTSGWADEARQHLEALPKARQSSAEEDKARVRAALEQGAPAIDRLAEESPSVLRDYFEDELLPAWAEAHLVGHPDAKLHREHARLVGDALFRTTGDAMHRDAARALVDTPASGLSRDPLRAQATGYIAFRDAKRLYGLQQPACSPFREALRDLEAGGSPYVAWAALQAVITCLFPSEQQAALIELSRLEAVAADGSYAQVLGRVQYMQGLIVGLRGDLTDSQERLRSARASFKKTQDAETEAWVLVKMAENLTFVGDGRAGWSDRVAALALLGHVRSPQRRYGILGEALTTCLDERMPRPALHFGDAAVDVAKTSLPWATSDAILRRAAVHYSLGADDAAAAEVLESRRWIARIADKSLSESLAAEADAVEGEILVRTNPEQAAHRLRQAIAHYQGIAPVRVPALHILLARARLVSGSDDAAESELLAGIEAMERGRISLGHADQVSFFDQALPLFEDMVRFQVAKRRDPDRALAFVERGRARQLVDSLAGAIVSPLDPDALRRELPDGLALIYYVSLDDRLFAWALDREGSHFIERPLRAADLSRLVAANRAAIEGRATPEVVRRTGAGLHDELVRPLLPFIGSQRALVLIPDGTLQSVAFASLWDRQRGHYLVEDYLLGVAASGTTFVRTSTRAATPFGTSPRALVVGNPQIDRRLWVRMPNLPGAEAEAVEIAALYPGSELLSGAAATKAAFLERARNSQVVHFAGHAAASADAPSAARLLFARDPATGDSGALYLHELGRPGLPRTRVVVLGACRTAAGTVSRVEGALSLGRPFLAAGVPDVVASLWDIDDTVSRRFFVSFHRALLDGGDPLLALRKAQIALLHADDSSLAHPASWAPFICMGGLDPHSLSKGEVS